MSVPKTKAGVSSRLAQLNALAIIPHNWATCLVTRSAIIEYFNQTKSVDPNQQMDRLRWIKLSEALMTNLGIQIPPNVLKGQGVSLCAFLA
jgi:hypothetical protein